MLAAYTIKWHWYFGWDNTGLVCTLFDLFHVFLWFLWLRLWCTVFEWCRQYRDSSGTQHQPFNKCLASNRLHGNLPICASRSTVCWCVILQHQVLWSVMTGAALATDGNEFGLKWLRYNNFNKDDINILPHRMSIYSLPCDIFVSSYKSALKASIFLYFIELIGQEQYACN